MTEITIEIHMQGQGSAVYRFAEPVVRIGRSEECHLRLCHKAVPRRLCSVWFEPEESTMCLEPHPGLTNPIVHCGAPLEEALRGARLAVSIGPLQLEAYAADEPRTKARHLDGRRHLLLTAGAVAVVLSALVVVGERSGDVIVDDPLTELGAALAASPLCTAHVGDCGDKASCRERARLARSRAKELLVRPSARGAQRIEAVRQLGLACDWLRRIGDADQAQVCTEQQRQVELLRQHHRSKSAALRWALSSDNLPQAAKLCLELADLLETCDPDAARTLVVTSERLKGGTP